MKCSDTVYNGSHWEWRTFGVADPGSSGPWEWRPLGVLDPGSGGPWEWRTLGVAGQNHLSLYPVSFNTDFENGINSS